MLFECTNFGFGEDDISAICSENFQVQTSAIMSSKIPRCNKYDLNPNAKDISWITRLRKSWETQKRFNPINCTPYTQRQSILSTANRKYEQMQNEISTPPKETTSNPQKHQMLQNNATEKDCKQTHTKKQPKSNGKKHQNQPISSSIDKRVKISTKLKNDHKITTVEDCIFGKLDFRSNSKHIVTTFDWSPVYCYVSVKHDKCCGPKHLTYCVAMNRKFSSQLKSFDTLHLDLQKKQEIAALSVIITQMKKKYNSRWLSHWRLKGQSRIRDNSSLSLTRSCIAYHITNNRHQLSKFGKFIRQQIKEGQICMFCIEMTQKRKGRRGTTFADKTLALRENTLQISNALARSAVKIRHELGTKTQYTRIKHAINARLPQGVRLPSEKIIEKATADYT